MKELLETSSSNILSSCTFSVTEDDKLDAGIWETDAVGAQQRTTSAAAAALQADTEVAITLHEQRRLL